MNPPQWAQITVIALLAAPAAARANSASDALRARAADQIYNLDRDLAIATYRQAIAADPQDAAAYRGLASGLWLSITFRRGSMTVDDYIGKVTRPASQAPPPPAETTAAFRDALDHALTLARARIARNPQDADAHYQLGAAVGLVDDGACSEAVRRHVAERDRRDVLEGDREPLENLAAGQERLAMHRRHVAR